jgi:hypothetical protein
VNARETVGIAQNLAALWLSNHQKLLFDDNLKSSVTGKYDPVAAW